MIATVARDADALNAEADALGAANILTLMLVKSQPVTLCEDEMASEQYWTMLLSNQWAQRLQAFARSNLSRGNKFRLRDSRGSNSPPPATPVSSTIVSARPDWHSMPSSHGRAFWFKSLMDPRKYAWQVLFFVGHPFFQQVLPALIDLIRSKLVYVELDEEIVQESGHFFENFPPCPCGYHKYKHFPNAHFC